MLLVEGTRAYSPAIPPAARSRGVPGDRLCYDGFMMGRLMCGALAAVGFGLAASSPAPADGADVAVDLELIVAIDCSYSVDAFEYRLQIDGVARAFRHPETVAAILGGPEGKIAVTVVQWAGAESQVAVVPWMIVGSVEDAEALAQRTESAPRFTQDGATSISGMIDFGIGYFRDNGIAGLRQVIDISTDGRNNTGEPIRPVRRRAGRAGVTVNGLTILTEHPTLNFYFEQKVMIGPGAFVEIANDYGEYVSAIQRKLLREIEAMQFAWRG